MAYIPDAAVDRMTELSSGAWRLYCYLARCRNQRSGQCNPSIPISAEAIGVHQRNIFKLRRELVEAGWAIFQGNSATFLLGFPSGKNATVNVANIGDSFNSGKNATNTGENATAFIETSGLAANSGKNASFPAVAKTPVKSGKNATKSGKNASAYKEEPAKNQQIEPAKRAEAREAAATETVRRAIAEGEQKGALLTADQRPAVIREFETAARRTANIHEQEFLASRIPEQDAGIFGEFVRGYAATYGTRNLNSVLSAYDDHRARQSQRAKHITLSPESIARDERQIRELLAQHAARAAAKVDAESKRVSAALEGRSGERRNPLVGPTAPPSFRNRRMAQAVSASALNTPPVTVQQDADGRRSAVRQAEAEGWDDMVIPF